MSGGDYRNRPSFHIPGKEFLIVIVVLFSSLSFTLGYFVGKSGRDTGAARPVTMEEPASPQKNADLYSPSDAGPRNSADRPAQDGVASGRDVDSGSPLPGNKAVSDPLSSQRHVADHPAKHVDGKPSSSKVKSQSGTISYTVQIGALSTEKDAEALRARYETKRYKVYVVPARNKKGETIYKIRIGKFRNRKDAELLSLKLKKTEGLSTFVTFKDK
jgi:cell division septation protein DedD